MSMISYSDEIILSNYMQHYEKKKFTEVVCFGLGFGLQFEYDSVTGIISPLRRNIIERFFQRLAYRVEIICIKQSYSHPVKQIRGYINNSCVPIIQVKGQYGLILSMDVENNFLIQNYEGKQQKLLIDEVVQNDNECRVFLIDKCINEDFPSNHDLKMIYRSAIYVDVSQYCHTTSTSTGLQGLASYFDNYSDDMKYSLASSFQLARNKYADWLDVVSDELGDHVFSDASEKCRLIAELWRKFQDANNRSIVDKKLLKDIYDSEAELCKDLCSIVQLKR